MRILRVLSGRALRILQTEGIVALFRRGLSFIYWRLRSIARYFFEYQSFYLYEQIMKERNEADFLPRIKDFTFNIISTNQQADELANKGFQDFRLYWRTARRGLDKGAIAFCIFVGHELAHIGWVAMNEEAKNTFDPWPYHVDFSANQACSGGTWTWPKYRGKNLMSYVYFKRFQFLLERGIKTCRNAVEIDNSASHRVHAKFGPKIYARARYIRIMQWYLRKETPIIPSAKD